MRLGIGEILELMNCYRGLLWLGKQGTINCSSGHIIRVNWLRCKYVIWLQIPAGIEDGQILRHQIGQEEYHFTIKVKPSSSLARVGSDVTSTGFSRSSDVCVCLVGKQR